MKLELTVNVLFTQEQLEWIVDAFAHARPPDTIEMMEEDIESLQRRMTSIKEKEWENDE